MTSSILERLCLALSVFHIGGHPLASMAFNPSASFITATRPSLASVTSINTAVITTLSKNNRHHDNGRNSIITKPIPSSFFSTTALQMSSSDETTATTTKSSLPVFLDPGTKGGVVVLSIILFVLPIIAYNVAVGPMQMDEITVGRNIGVGFSIITMLLWGSTYIFRVATKDMTYAKQLKDYEDAVIAKRLEELDDDEVQALVEDIERERF